MSQGFVALSRHLRSQILSLAFLIFGLVNIQAAEPELVNIKTLDPTIVVELRYSGTRNIAQRPLYPPNMPALVRPSVAERLVKAQVQLQLWGYGLKIWDAYRPKGVHEQLWQISQNKDYLANPADGLGSLHTWGVAVDATIVDKEGRDVTMPTDFDNFTPAAMLRYQGSDLTIKRHLQILQRAMARAGFYGNRTEWWHFISRDWTNYRAIDDVTLSPQGWSVSEAPGALANGVGFDAHDR